MWSLVYSPTKFVRFAPSRVEGMDDVREVIVQADRLEINVRGQWLIFLFRDMRDLDSPKDSGCVGEREWCRPPTERFFRWYSNPQITTFMPSDESPSYGTSLFPQIHEVLDQGGFHTFDLA